MSGLSALLRTQKLSINGQYASNCSGVHLIDRSSEKTAARVLRVSSDNTIIVYATSDIIVDADATFGVIRVDLLRLMPLRGSFFSSGGSDVLRLRDE